MVKFLVPYDEPEDREAFYRHCQEVHIPLAKKIPGLRRYTVSATLVLSEAATRTT